MSRRVLVTGGTGYLGQALIPELLSRGHAVRVLLRPGSEKKSRSGAEIARGNPLNSAEVRPALEGCDTLVHLVGVPKPSPSKAALFRTIDLVSIRASVEAAASCAPSPHLVYLSVAHPSPVMKAYIAVRQEGEALITAQGLRATYLRPWYVLGPGHRWPGILIPLYAFLRQFPATRDSATRLGLVNLAQMIAALVFAVENPPVSGARIVDVPGIRAAVSTD